jgi:N-acetylmuramoyl-L-alanine amidase
MARKGKNIFAKPDRAVDRVFLHCSASDHSHHDNIATKCKGHVEDRGWSDVGYYFFIRKDGTVEDGCPLERTPAAQGANNSGTIAICLHALALENFTEAQCTSMVKFY